MSAMEQRLCSTSKMGMTKTLKKTRTGDIQVTAAPYHKHATAACLLRDQQRGCCSRAIAVAGCTVLFLPNSCATLSDSDRSFLQ